MDLTKVCLVCEQELPIIKFDKHTSGSRRNICERCRNLRKRSHLWICFLEEFDFKCSCCGEDDIRFLTLDHIKNDGAVERAEGMSNDNIVLLRRAKEEGFDRTKYTCLCWNCNCGRHRNKGICPHKANDKEQYKQLYINSAKHLMKRGRAQVYAGKSVLERNRSAQVVHHVSKGTANLSQEEIRQLIAELQNTIQP